jgi:hypothetical protein
MVMDALAHEPGVVDVRYSVRSRAGRLCPDLLGRCGLPIRVGHGVDHRDDGQDQHVVLARDASAARPSPLAIRRLSTLLPGQDPLPGHDPFD